MSTMSNNEVDENTRRDTNRVGSTNLKIYQELLVKNMMGTSRHNQPLQAVVDNQLDEVALTETNNSILERNRALLQYVATIANSNSSTDEFNYEFVESLVTGGADPNVTDLYQQSIFHEVARSWNIDVATFLLDIGCDINKKDRFGRSPLHVAAAVDFADMTKFLIQNNANIDARTFGEQQAPIHYAAKNGAVRSLKMLLGFHADINSFDGKQRTPLQLAAEWTRDSTVRVLLDEGAASCLLDSTGTSALCILIDRLPNFSLEALNQLHTTDLITMEDSYYLQYLESTRLQKETKNIRTPLDAAVMTCKYEVVTHPVMDRLIHNKWKQFGRFSTIMDLLFHILYGIMWTATSLGLPSTAKELWKPFESTMWLKIIVVLISIMTLYDIFVQIQTTMKSRKSQKAWVTWRINELLDDVQYCHPRWPQEQKYLDLEIKRVKSLPLMNALGAWFYLEWVVLILIVATAAMHFVYYVKESKDTRYLYTRALSIVNLLVWLRLLKYVRPFPGIGTLVVILGETARDFINWAFLFFLLLIPFTAAFWINFGGLSIAPVIGYEQVNRLLYSVFRIAVGDDFNLEGLVEADPVMSRILTVLYVTAMTIVTLNLLIALLTDTFSRVHSNAVANTIMQRAIKVMNAERILTKKGRMKYQEFMRINCSPEIIPIRVDVRSSPNAEQIAKQDMYQHLTSMSELISDRFATVYGNNKASDFDAIIQDVRKLTTCQEELLNDLKKIYEMLKLYAGHDIHDPKSPNRYGKTRRRGTERTSKRDRVSAQEESKGMLSAIREAASSLVESLAGGNADKKRGSGSKNRGKSASSGRESGERSRQGRRRRHRQASGADEDRTTSTKKRRTQNIGTGNRDHRRTAMEHDPNELALSAYDPSHRRVGHENVAFEKVDDTQWDTVSAESLDC